jgi:hypothetical protein
MKMARATFPIARQESAGMPQETGFKGMINSARRLAAGDQCPSAGKVQSARRIKITGGRDQARP